MPTDGTFGTPIHRHGGDVDSATSETDRYRCPWIMAGAAVVSLELVGLPVGSNAASSNDDEGCEGQQPHRG